MIDSGGLYGAYLHYGLVIFMVGGSMIAALYFWFKGILNFDETPKMQMMEENDE